MHLNNVLLAQDSKYHIFLVFVPIQIVTVTLVPTEDFQNKLTIFNAD